jgi:urea transport system permease protein
MEVVISNVFAGVSVGAVLLLIALGLTFTFGQMNVINFAHGELIMAGAYTGFVLQGLVGVERAGTAFVLALPAAFVLAGLLGLAMERTLIRRLYGRPLDTLLVTWGLSLILQEVARDIFGAPNVQVVRPSWLQGAVGLGPVVLPWTRLFIILLMVASVAGIGLFLGRLPQGRRMRAVMQSRQLAAVSGIGTDRVDAVTFLVGSGLAGIAGVALTLLGPIGPSLGTFYIVDAFLVVIVGGLGHLRGAVLAALAIGVLNVFVEFSSQASIAKAIVFAAVIAFLQYRPQGLFSYQSRALT